MTKQKRNFNYKPRYQNSGNDASQDDIQTKWQELKHGRSRKGGFLSSPAFLVLFLIGLLVLVYILSRYE